MQTDKNYEYIEIVYKGIRDAVFLKSELVFSNWELVWSISELVWFIWEIVIGNLYEKGRSVGGGGILMQRYNTREAVCHLLSFIVIYCHLASQKTSENSF